MKSKNNQNQFKSFLPWIKNYFAFLGVLLAITIYGCSNDSKSSSSDPIAGQWKLVSVDGTFAGIHDTFPAGTITWDFNPITQTVTVTNNNTNSNLWDLFDTGIYTYHFVNVPDAPCSQSLDIDGTVYGCYTFSNDSLVIDQSIADGFAVTLKR